MISEPREVLRRWLPHILMLAAIVASVWLVAHVVTPLFEPILMAAALAMLTAPVLSEPVYGWLRRKFPKLSDEWARKIAGITATVLLAAALLTPVIIVLVSSAKSLEEVADLLVGIVTRSPEQLKRLEAMIQMQIEDIDRIYPRLNLKEAGIAEGIRGLLGEAMGVSTAFISFVVKGTSAAAQMALAIISLAFFYVEGPAIARTLLHYSPLREDQQDALVTHNRSTVLRLLSDTVASAIVKGLVLGGLVWGIDQIFVSGYLPFFPVAVVAGVITLLPLVGVTIVWLPVASVMFPTHPVAAVVLAISCWTANFAIEHFREKVGRRIDDRSSWRSFLLFLGLIGGLISFGLKGLIIGPMSVVLVSTVCSAWLPLYGGDDDTPHPDDALPPSAPVDEDGDGDVHDVAEAR